jgi:D-lactate dehydrogenase (cytochrome)
MKLSQKESLSASPEVRKSLMHENLIEALTELRTFLGERVTDVEIIREHHSHGESHHEALLPDLVCFPKTTEEVSQIVVVSKRFGIPIIPFGAGSSLEGHVAALHGGITVCMREMNKILALNVDDLDACVEAGVTCQKLNHALRTTGLTFFVDPGAECTIGGMAATGASGTTAVRYGTMRENVLGLKVVLPDGQIIHTGTRARKSSAGYDLTRLFVGSEGTLGVITEISLKLHAIPEAISAATCAFPILQGAVETVMSTMQLGIPVARMELLDDKQVEAINRFSGTKYPACTALFFEFHGDDERQVSQIAARVELIATEHGGQDFQWATRLEEREKLWKARHDAYYAAVALRPGCKAMITDVCVPISRLGDCILETKREHVSTPFPVTLVGHVGDGNFHMIYLLDPGSPTELAEAKRLVNLMVHRAINMGGTCTGEHGVGLGKMEYLKAEHGSALTVMSTIKRAIDPDNRMNPGKTIPW